MVDFSVISEEKIADTFYIFTNFKFKKPLELYKPTIFIGLLTDGKFELAKYMIDHAYTVTIVDFEFILEKFKTNAVFRRKWNDLITDIDSDWAVIQTIVFATIEEKKRNRDFDAVQHLYITYHGL